MFTFFKIISLAFFVATPVLMAVEEDKSSNNHDSPTNRNYSYNPYPAGVKPRSFKIDLNAGISILDQDNGLSDDEDVPLPFDPLEVDLFELIDKEQWDALLFIVEEHSRYSLEQTFIENKRNGLNSLKYAVFLKKPQAVRIIAQRCVDFGIISKKKMRRYIAQAIWE